MGTVVQGDLQVFILVESLVIIGPGAAAKPGIHKHESVGRMMGILLINARGGTFKPDLHQVPAHDCLPWSPGDPLVLFICSTTGGGGRML